MLFVNLVSATRASVSAQTYLLRLLLVEFCLFVTVYLFFYFQYLPIIIAHITS